MEDDHTFIDALMHAPSTGTDRTLQDAVSDARPQFEALRQTILTLWHSLRAPFRALSDAEAVSVVAVLYPNVTLVRSLFGNTRGNRLLRLARRQFLIPRLRSQTRLTRERCPC